VGRPATIWANPKLHAALQGNSLMASGNEMKAHNATYEGFINMVKYATPAVALIAVVVVFLISR